MAFTLIPREEKFFALFEEQTRRACEAAQTFLELVRHWDLESPQFKKLRDIEHEADITTHEIMDRLNRTFITPFDREDIHELGSEMDDIVDLIESIASRMQLYQIRACREEVAPLAEVLLQACETLQKAVACLKNLSQSRRLLDYCIEINRLENTGDQLVRGAIGRLFAAPSDPMEVMKWERVLESLETAIDKCEDVANTIEGILVKHG